MSNYPANIIPRAKIPCLLTEQELISLGNDNLVALREIAERCGDNPLEALEQGAFGNRFSGRGVSKDEIAKAIVAESDLQVELLTRAIRTARGRKVPRIPEFRPNNWFKPNDYVFILSGRPEPKFWKGRVDTRPNPFFDVGPVPDPDCLYAAHHGQYHLQTIKVILDWECDYFRSDLGFAITWTRVVNALNPDNKDKNYDLFAAILNFYQGYY